MQTAARRPRDRESVFRGDGVVTLAGLYFEGLLALAALDVDLAVGAVGLVVGRGIAGDVLGAQLVFDLLEGGFQLFAVVARRR